MRKIPFLVMAIICAWFTTGYAEEITVVTEEYPPYNYTENNVVTGCSTEIVQEVLTRAGIEYSIKSYPWARAYKMAQDKPNVLIYSIGRNENRENLFKWVDVVAPFDIYFFKVKARTDIEVKQLDEAKKYRIGAVRDDVRAQYLERKGFKADKDLELVPQDAMSLKKLLAGRIDLIPIDKLGLAYLMKKEGLDIGDLEPVMLLEDLSTGLYLAFSLQTDDAIVEKCKKALSEMKEDGTYDKIMSKYVK